MNEQRDVNRRSYLEAAGVTVTAGLFAGCSSSTGTGSTDTGSGSGGTTYGTLATSVTDRPNDIGDFESLVVTIDGLWVKPAGGTKTDKPEPGSTGTESMNETKATDTKSVDGTGTESTETKMDSGTESTGTEMDSETESTETKMDGGNGRRYIGFKEPQEADLVQLQGGNSKLIDETEVKTGQYKFLQLDIGGTKGTLTDGSEADVQTPGNAPLKVNTSFEVRKGERTTFVADFTPVQRGNGSYIIRPVASGATVRYGNAKSTAEASTATGSAATATESGRTRTKRGGKGKGNN